MIVKLLDGKKREFSSPKTVEEIAGEISISLKKTTFGALVNSDYLVPKDFLITKDVEIQFITKDNMTDDILNNTASFLLLTVLKKLYPNLKLGDISYNQDELEFHADFLLEPRLKLEQLKDCQKEIKSVLNKRISFKSLDWNVAKKLFENEPYQLEIAKMQFEKQNFVSVYSVDDIYYTTSKLLLTGTNNFFKVVELQQLTGSYWKDSSKNVMLQRIHGMIGKNDVDLKNKKEIIDERRSSDHRIINQQLEVFGFDFYIGAGLPLWLPNGTIIKDEIKKYLKIKEWEYDYIQVQTPVIGTTNLYKISGHWDHYREDMFQPFKNNQDSGEEFVLRPMNCPHHIAVYKQKLHSYKELPIRIAEHAMQYRYESSGSLTGLERVRSMELTDSHIFVRPDQVGEEFKLIYKLIQEVLETFNIKIDYLSFSVRDSLDKEKYFPDDEMWNRSESEMEKVLKELNLNYKRVVGEAAFYGPKLDIQIKTVQNHEITISTIQLDFLLPKKFNVSYIDKNQNLQHPIMIHRGLIGTYERFIAILLEQTKGVLPLWLAPLQVAIIPVGGDEIENYVKFIRTILKQKFIRTEIDIRDERLSYKIRDAQTKKIPYQLVIGIKEKEKNVVTYREYGKAEQITLSLEEFVNKLLKKVDFKK